MNLNEAVTLLMMDDEDLKDGEEKILAVTHQNLEGDKLMYVDDKVRRISTENGKEVQRVFYAFAPGPLTWDDWTVVESMPIDQSA